jgi:hypothetical protein
MKLNNILRLCCWGLIAVSWITSASADDAAKSAKQTKSREQLLRHVESLQVKDVAWRKIPWKTCLLDGIRESRKQHKPIMLWVFIDRPIDDERC